MASRIPSRDTFDDVVAKLKGHEESCFFLIIGYEQSKVFHRAFSSITRKQFRVFKKEILNALDNMETTLEKDEWT